VATWCPLRGWELRSFNFVDLFVHEPLENISADYGTRREAFFTAMFLVTPSRKRGVTGAALDHSVQKEGGVKGLRAVL